MKKDIHPVYHQAVVTCSCGNTFTVGSTQKEIHTELCSLCHPFYTGQQKLVDTAGRVERFRSKLRTAEEKKEKEKVRRRKKAEQIIGGEASPEEAPVAEKQA